MHIREVKTAKYVGKFILREDNSPNLIDIEYSSSIPISILKDDSPRVYLITVDNIIKKIGGSSGKGGIKNTVSFYINARTGSPGPVRFIIHGLIARELKKGKSVDLYMITSQKVKAKICGLFDCNEALDIASFKEMEDLCKFDYLVYNIENFIIKHKKKLPYLSKHIQECFIILDKKIQALKNLRKDFHVLHNYIYNLNIESEENLSKEIKNILNINYFFSRFKIPQNYHDFEEFKILILEALTKRYKEIISKPKEKIKRELACLQKQGYSIKPFPEWNFQENNDPYPEDLYSEYLRYHTKRINK